ncbi:phosphatidylcholine:ceramide cholinephosphotransferase 2 isoform X2 [Salmo salar]|uniref:Phosphatidylcholine:ceramide cholinephosphotransferase 2 isoform X2 n=1 Tax=Salmo salar TaxID=8030 RepID=A0A1S3NAA8_SALSA|nr:phosphatidylcholine:ceramide cholinephosphotransferase 2 isoform X2 [Salmo salar]|eukprot:XP_014012352.1 PREDICTED: phosphatidylcholine:ceramide cholinephosphotransferase 2-like isoform X2 [Salmo salar]
MHEDEEKPTRGHYHLEVSVTMESQPPPPHIVPNGNPSSSTITDHIPNAKLNQDDRRTSGGASSKSSRLIRSLSNGLRKHSDYIKISVPEGRSNRLPREWWKTGVAFVYALFNLILTTVIITVVHERVPDKSVSPPLPDKFFDYVDRVPWAFTVTEVNGMVLVGLWFIQWLFLKHKSIIGRRCFFMIGTLYMYRCVTMYITTLPVPGRHFTCAPKLYGDSEGMVWRILGLISGGGLSITGGHLMCGDFLYSGHTVTLTLAYLFIQEYSPKKMWWYVWLCWLLSAVGVVCILIGHEHYSIDVVFAYFITSRLFWWYHTMANTQALRGASNNYLSRTWWNPVFNFLERNVMETVPCAFSCPVSLPSAWCNINPCERYSMVEGDGNRDE